MTPPATIRARCSVKAATGAAGTTPSAGRAALSLGGLLERVKSAGSIFLGDYSAVAAGDYASGTNHILPTGGAARLRGGLSAADFVKTISVQRLNRGGLARLRRAIVTLATVEGLKAHAYSIETRLNAKSDK